jgi:LuxR family maltose regulon positive regulatory protein
MVLEEMLILESMKPTAAIISEAERLMQRWQVSEHVYQNWIAIVKANIWISLDKWDRAQECLNRVIKEQDQLGVNHTELFPMQSGLYHVSCARLLFQKKEYSNVIRALDSASLNDQAGIVQLSGILLKAAVYESTKEIGKARKAWQQALQLAEREKIQLNLSKFISKSMVDLEFSFGSTQFSALPTTDMNSESKHDVAALKTYPAFIDSSNLSIREQEVLVLIAEGNSNQGIADQLFISLHTVKTHARKINAKLGAKSRTQAIVKARERMII